MLSQTHVDPRHSHVNVAGLGRSDKDAFHGPRYPDKYLQGRAIDLYVTFIGLVQLEMLMGNQGLGY